MCTDILSYNNIVGQLESLQNNMEELQHHSLIHLMELTC